MSLTTHIQLADDANDALISTLLMTSNVTFDGSKMKRYIDGVFVGETTLPVGTLDAVFTNRRMGRFGNSSTYYSNGDIYDLRIYNSDKSDAFFGRVFQKTDKLSVAKYTGYIRSRIG